MVSKLYQLDLWISIYTTLDNDHDTTWVRACARVRISTRSCAVGRLVLDILHISSYCIIKSHRCPLNVISQQIHLKHCVYISHLKHCVYISHLKHCVYISVKSSFPSLHLCSICPNVIRLIKPHSIVCLQHGYNMEWFGTNDTVFKLPVRYRIVIYFNSCFNYC